MGYSSAPYCNANISNSTSSDYSVIYTCPANSYAKVYLSTTSIAKSISFNGAIGPQETIESSKGLYGPYFVGPGAVVEVLGSGGGGTVYIFGSQFVNGS